MTETRKNIKSVRSVSLVYWSKVVLIVSLFLPFSNFICSLLFWIYTKFEDFALDLLFVKRCCPEDILVIEDTRGFS